MAAERLPVQLVCRVLDISESGYYDRKIRAPSQRAIRHAWLTDRIRQIHLDSRRTYGSRRVHAELRLGHGVEIGHGTVQMLMRRAGVVGATGRPKWRRNKPDSLAADRVDGSSPARRRTSSGVTDVTERPTREGKFYCAVVLDTYSRRVVGWAIDSSPNATLVTNALGIVIDARRPPTGTVIPSDQGTVFGSWAFTQRAKDSGLLPSMGSVGYCYDNSMLESFWSRMQVELLDTKRWKRGSNWPTRSTTTSRSGTTAGVATASSECSPIGFKSSQSITVA